MKHPIKKIGIKHLDWLALVLETDLPAYSKMLAMYLSRFMNRDQDMAWPSLSRITQELSITRATACKYIDLLENEGWLMRNRGNSTTTTRYHIGFPKELEGVVHEMNYVVHDMNQGSSPHELGVVHHTDTNSQLQSLSKINKKENGRFAPPTLQEVQQYVKEMSFNMDAESFVDHFTSNGWKVGGKAPMKCWKSAVRGWAKRQASFQKKPTGAKTSERLRQAMDGRYFDSIGDDSGIVPALLYCEENGK